MHYYCIAGNLSSALFCLPQSQNNPVIITLFGKLYCKPFPMHECLAGKCEAPAGTVMCPVWPSLSLPLLHDWRVVRNASLSYFHNSSVTWIAIAIDLWQSDQFSLINTTHFNISLLLGCHSASFRLGPLAARSCFPTWAFWPPGNWSNLPSDYHKNHLI